VFSFSRDWHQDDRARPLVRQYEVALDAAVRGDRDLDLGRCVVRCCHCGIRFLTDPRNAGRRNLRCPFGCREQHRKQCANRRSARYYRTAEGRQKKKLRNAQRSLGVDSPAGDALTSRDDFAQEVCSDFQIAKACHAESRRGPVNVEPAEEMPGKVELPLEGVVLDEASVVGSPILPYVRMVASLIEGRNVSERELVDALLNTLRQRSMARRTRSRYVLHFLHRHPP
jgi:hypothetical protein